MVEQQKIKKLLEVNKKNVLIFLLAGIVFMSVYYALIIYDNTKVEKFDISDYQIGNEQAEFSIDSLNIGKTSTTLRGWEVTKGVSTELVNTHFVLVDDSYGYILNTEVENRNDVTVFFNDGLNYDNSGIVSLFLNSKFEKGKEYNIYILYENESLNIKYLLDTGKKFCY